MNSKVEASTAEFKPIEQRPALPDVLNMVLPMRGTKQILELREKLYNCITVYALRLWIRYTYSILTISAN